MRLRTGNRRRARCSAALVACAALAACTDRVGDRFSAQSVVSTERFGDDDRLRAVASPGVVAVVDDTRVDIRLSAPFGSASLDNGSTSEASVTFAVSNVRPDWTWRATASALPDDARRDPLCSDADYAQRATVQLAEPSPITTGTTRVELELVAPPCARIVVVAEPPRDSAELTFVVLPPLSGDTVALVRALDAAVAHGAAFVHASGDSRLRPDDAPFSYLDAAAAARSLPVVIGLAPPDVERSGAALLEYTGPTTWRGALGRVPYLVIDTASRRLSDGQVSWLRAIPTNQVHGVALTATSPVSFGTTVGLRSQLQGLELVAALADRGFSDVIVGGAARPDVRTFGATRVIDLGRASSIARVAVVTVLNPWPDVDPCSSATDCDAGSCVEGLCRVRCETDSACAPGVCAPGGVCAPACDAATDCGGSDCTGGACAVEPRVTVTTVEF